MKTAMQELMEFAESRIDMCIHKNIDQRIQYAYEVIFDKAKELLEKEKQQIIEAANYANGNPPNGKISSGEDYYNRYFTH